MVKRARIGNYGPRTRKLQRKLSFERISQTWKIAQVYKYMGSRAYDDPQISDIQTTTFMEVPDRAYEEEPVAVNIFFEPKPEQMADYSQYGVIDPLGNRQTIKIHINSYEEIGRPIVEGDVFDVPFFHQGEQKAFWEVSDVDRSQEFEKFYAVLTMKELEDSRETREIDIGVGSLDDIFDDVGEQQDKEQNDYVPHDGVDDFEIDNDEENDKVGEDYEPRKRGNQSSFLDDFDGEFIE